MTRALRWFALVSLCGVCVSFDATAFAQDGQDAPPEAAESAEGADAAEEAQEPEPSAEEQAAVEQARALFTEGVEFVRNNDFESAAQRFQAALALHEAASIHHNLAAALVELGRFGEAYPHVQVVLADGEVAPSIRQEAEALDVRLRDELAFLRLNLGDADPNVEVLLDDAPRSLDELREPLPVPPGAHHLLVRRGDETLLDRDFTLAAGERSSIELLVREGEVVVAPGSIELVERGGDDSLAIGLGVGIGGGVLVLGAIAVVLALIFTAESEMPIEGNFLPAVVTFP